MKQEFSTFDIDKLLGINRNCLQQWLDGGFINPSIKRATRRGTKNIFSIGDLYKIRLFEQLLETGISRGEAKFYASVNFKDVGNKKDQYKYAVIKRRKAKSGRDSGVFSDIDLTKQPPKISLDKDDSFAMVINLLKVKEEVDRIID